MARPVKYTKEFKQALKQRFERYIDETDMPSVTGFAVIEKIPKQNLWDFAEKDKEFSALIKRANDKQELWALNAGRDGFIKATFPIFLLKNHGYTDKQEVVQTVQADMNVKQEVINETKLSIISDKNLIKDVLLELEGEENEE